MAYLFFDVETTGLPINHRVHYSRIDNWPRIVQISWLVASPDGAILKESDNIIKVDFPIPKEVSEIHGITNLISEQKGVKIVPVLKTFLYDLEAVDNIVCHNLDFDLNVLQSELVRLELPSEINKETFCTMKNATNYCQLPGNKGYKWPRLEELYRICFGRKIKNAHNAMADVRATHKIFYHLVQEKVFSI
jgi:DNA polymerase III epsilon subunit-like protein